MTDQNNTKQEEDFDKALIEVPEEVREFMWSDAYTYILDVAQKALSLTDSEKAAMRVTSYNLLLRITDMETESKNMLSSEIDPEKITKILYTIHTQILTAAKNIMKYDQYIDDEIASNEGATAPTPSDMLARLNQTFIKPTTLSSTKRDLSNEGIKSIDTVPKSSSSIDPYRELPDK